MQGVEESINDVLEEYLDEVDEISEKEFVSAAKDLVNDLKSTSPKRTGRYAGAWTYKKEGNTYIIYNKRGQLTHLLENGHIIRNKKGEYGRAPAHPHIKNAEQRAVQSLIQKLESKL